jgi:hypothetical protein
MADNKYLSILNGYVICDDEARARLDALEGGAAGKQYVKEFTKADFTQVEGVQKYYVEIRKSLHGLKNPFCNEVIVTKSDNGETETYMTSVLFSSRFFKSTETIRIYVTIDLSKYKEYSGKIYLKGE